MIDVAEEVSVTAAPSLPPPARRAVSLALMVSCWTSSSATVAAVLLSAAKLLSWAAASSSAVAWAATTAASCSAAAKDTFACCACSTQASLPSTAWLGEGGAQLVDGVLSAGGLGSFRWLGECAEGERLVGGADAVDGDRR